MERIYPFPTGGFCCFRRERIYAFRLQIFRSFAILNVVIHMELPQRKLPRLTGYDYSTPGAYFVTICTFHKQCILGEIIADDLVGDAQMIYSPIGEIVSNCLLAIEEHFHNVALDNWVIMPNHIHILLRIEGETERIYPFPTADLSKIIGTFKAAVTRKVGNAYMRSGKLWQTSFYEHIVRCEEDYQNIWQYISGNPSKWLEDCYYCE